MDRALPFTPSDPGGPAAASSYKLVIQSDPVVIDAPPRVHQEPALDLPPTAPELLTVIGKPRSGKDVVADYLEDTYRGVQRLAFSDPIKREVNEYLAGTGHVIDDANKSVAMYRRLLQDWAVARRGQDPHYWTKVVEASIRALKGPQTHLIVITGPRDQADYDLIRELRGQAWKVIRPGLTYDAPHAIESGLDYLSDSDFDQVLYNTVEGDITAYHAIIRAALEAK